MFLSNIEVCEILRFLFP